MEYSFEQAAALDSDVIVIFENPNNYVNRILFFHINCINAI